jgi:hypothetical protein
MTSSPRPIGRGAGDAERGRERLRAALDLWRGPAPADVPSDALRPAMAERLRNLRFTALSRRIELDLRLGEHGLDEPPRLMSALDRDGRRAEALAAYEDVRRAAEPGGESRRLHQALLARRPEPGRWRRRPGVRRAGCRCRCRCR